MKKNKNNINSVINGICARMTQRFANILYCYEYCMMSGVHSVKILTPNLFLSNSFQSFIEDELWEYAKLGNGCNLAFYGDTETL